MGATGWGGGGGYGPERKERMPATACPSSRIAAVISAGVKTVGAELSGVQIEETSGADECGVPAMVVSGGVVVAGGGSVVVAWDVDMIAPETADTRLVGTGVLPGRALRLYGWKEGRRACGRDCRRWGAVIATEDDGVSGG